MRARCVDGPRAGDELLLPRDTGHWDVHVGGREWARYLVLDGDTDNGIALLVHERVPAQRGELVEVTWRRTTAGYAATLPSGDEVRAVSREGLFSMARAVLRPATVYFRREGDDEDAASA